MIRLVTLPLLLMPLCVPAQFVTGRETTPGRWIWSYNAMPFATERRGPGQRRITVWGLHDLEADMSPMPYSPMTDPFYLYDPWAGDGWMVPPCCY